jgi:hypothetical protein
MKPWRTMAAAAALCLAAFPAAANLLVNGSFEGLAGWTLVESGPFSPGNCDFESLPAGATTSGFAGFTAPAPIDGTKVLQSDANAPGTCQFFQDVVIPSGLASLTYAAGYQYFNVTDPAGTGCSATVQLATTANVPISTGFTATGAAPVAMAPQPTLVAVVTPGSTVRVLITVVSCLGGPAGISADNFVLAGGTPVPTLGDGAKLALALLMAISGAGFARRMRT